METNKLRVIQDYDKLSSELKEQIKLVYPDGYSQHLIEFPNAKGERVTALRFETFEKIYMIRMSVQKAEMIIQEDADFDDDGSLRDEIKEKYSDEYSELGYLSENENYEASDDDDD